MFLQAKRQQEMFVQQLSLEAIKQGVAIAVLR